jgi:outer membrane murein-binding lipoprotein Lpp
MIKCARCGQEIPDNSLICPYCGTKPEQRIGFTPESGAAGKNRAAGKILLIVAAVLIAALLFAAGRLLHDKNDLKEKVGELEEQTVALEAENESLSSQVRDLTKQKKEAENEAASARLETEQAKELGQQYETIRDWLKEHGAEYHADSDFYAGSNLIAVKVGKTTRFDLHSNYNIWQSHDNDYLTTQWGPWTGANTTYLDITGLQAGMTEIVFSEGKSSDKLTEKYRVLVIVYE